MRVDGAFYTLDDVPALDKNKKHSIELVVDRLVNKEGIRGRLADSVELALRYGEGRLILHEPDKALDGSEGGGDSIHSTTSVCPHCHISLPRAQSAAFFLQRSARGLPALRGPGQRGLFRSPA